MAGEPEKATPTEHEDIGDSDSSDEDSDDDREDEEERKDLAEEDSLVWQGYVIWTLSIPAHCR
ncbi:hypothetical protein HYPSUDRAFT_45289 [Hypholoma sublateritium FD-334 SS-4]|uniref:Uncharacterized protein n=1 Tax=Hypholoma sublateritium (strain FD-334 SS-4) TaxID=945553 RepID=A0A0D2NNR2_HYPSF|nr:hypothetical protein HYPSUDRAFT_45289 [Hypholoma sublateritium FD-334 SS-4]